MKIPRSLVCIGVGALVSATTVEATPYASECTNISGTIQYYLNETPTSVTVTYEDGTHPLSMNPATPAVGLNSFPLGTHTSYTISVNKVGAGTPIQLSSDANIYCQWPSLRGLALNSNPKSGNFGRIYIGSSASGSGKANKGIYVLNSDQSSLLGGTNGLTTSFWANSSTSGPYRMSVGRQDDNLYVGDLSSANAGVYQFDPNLALSAVQVLGGLGNTAGQAIGVHGEEIGSPKVLGSSAAGNLVLYTTDYVMPVDADNANSTLGYNTVSGDYNNIFQYQIGANAFPWTNPPNLAINAQVPSIATLVEEVDIGSKTGNIYLGNYRANYAVADLEVFDPTGMNLLYTSNPNVPSGPDPFNPAMTVYGSGTYSDGVTLLPGATGTAVATQNFAPYCMAVSPDEKYVACGLVNNAIFIMTINNGLPDPTTLQIIPNYPNDGAHENCRGIAWDAGDNVYTISSGTGLLRVFSLGLTTTCVTTNDSTGTNGSFSLSAPSISASVTATTPMAYQANNSYANNGATATSAQYDITLSAAQTGPITISFTMGGTGTNTVNYYLTNNGVRLSGPTYSVTFPAGVTDEAITLTPTASPVSGPTLSAVLSLKGGSAYSAVAPSVATAYIANSGPQVFNVDAAIPGPTMYRGTPGDYAYFQVDRWGDTNISITLPASVFSYSGTAVKGTDYTLGVSDVTFPAGATSEYETNGNPQLTPPGTYPYTYVGNESIIDTMTSGTSPESIPFTIGPTASATLTLIDNANPPESVLFSDSLSNPSDTGWDLAFGSVGTGTATTPTPTVVKNYLSAAPNYSGDALHDYDVEIGFDLTTDSQVTANPPNGSTKVLKMTMNKDPNVTYNNGTSTVNGASGAVNLYPADGSGNPLVFSGNFALRFNELDIEDSGGYATEFTECGINHYGTNANWWAGSYTGGAGNTNIDGVWYALGCDQGGASFGDALEFTSSAYPNAGWTSLGTKSWGNFTSVFKHPPYNATGTGSPVEGNGNNANIWNDVEIKQFNNVVTLLINKSVVYSYTNTSGLWKSGDVMLGYGDPFDSIGTAGRVYYSNVRVVRLNGPTITGVSVSNGNVVITFTSNDTDATPSSFGVVSSSTVGGAYSNTAATITQSGATYTATTAYSGTGSKFFAIKQTNIVQ